MALKMKMATIASACMLFLLVTGQLLVATLVVAISADDTAKAAAFGDQIGLLSQAQKYPTVAVDKAGLGFVAGCKTTKICDCKAECDRKYPPTGANNNLSICKRNCRGD